MTHFLYFIKYYTDMAMRKPITEDTAIRMMCGITGWGRNCLESFTSEFWEKIMPMGKVRKRNFYHRTCAYFDTPIIRYMLWYENNIEKIKKIKEKPNPYYHLNEFCKDAKQVINVIKP